MQAPLLSTVQMDIHNVIHLTKKEERCQHIYFISNDLYYRTVTLVVSTFTDGPIVVVTLTDFM